MDFNQPKSAVGRRRFLYRIILPVCFIPIVFSGLTSLHFQQKEDDDWMVYGGNKAGNRYSTLSQINTGNVAKLQVAWQYDAAKRPEGAPAPRRAMEIQCQPIMCKRYFVRYHAHIEPIRTQGGYR
jgi:hypothetical protein